MFALLLFFLSFSYQTTLIANLRSTANNITENVKPFFFDIKNQCEKKFYIMKEKYDSCRNFLRANLKNLVDHCHKYFMHKIKSDYAEEEHKESSKSFDFANIEEIKRLLEQHIKENERSEMKETPSSVKEESQVPAEGVDL